MKRKNIVGIVGQAGSGKDEMAGYLVKNHYFVQIALADHIKRFCKEVFGFTEDQLWGPSHLRNEIDKRLNLPDFWPHAFDKIEDGTLDEWLEVVAPFGSKDHLIKTLQHWIVTLEQQYTEFSPRIILQSLGTEWGRDTVHKDMWISIVVDCANQTLDSEARYTYNKAKGMIRNRSSRPIVGVAVSDVRFNNELDYIHKNGGKLIKIVRDETDKLANTVGIKDHQSETELKTFDDELFDAIIQNNYSLSEFHQNIDVIASSLVPNV